MDDLTKQVPVGTPDEVPGGSATGTSGLPLASFAPRIGAEDVARARVLYDRCRRGKAALDRRVIEGEEWYRMRYDAQEGAAEKGTTQSTSGWLFNNLANKHADAMDNYPRPNLLPQEAGDEAEAEMLSSIVPAILRQVHFEDTYSAVEWDKIKTGTGIYGVFWDAAADGGLGCMAIRPIDILALLWDPGVSDIQDARNVFLTTLHDRDALLERYPQLVGDIGASHAPDAAPDYRSDDPLHKENKVAVVDWYYKKWQSGRELLHFCQYCGNTILYATENDPLWADRGLYDHGKFPFVADVLYPVKNSPAGFGMIDVCKSPQMFIDQLDSAILENARQGAKPRYFAPVSSNVSKEAFLDVEQALVEYAGQGADIIPIVTKPLDSVYMSVREAKIAELKEVSGNRDATTGGTTAGVTAASAIAAMIETGSKLSRDSSRGSYRAFRVVVELMVELIRQFYTVPHKFRIVGEDGMVRFIRYSSANIALTPEVDPVSGKVYTRKPLFDIEITAERSSPYSRISQNELMLQLYNAGFFLPGNADASIAAIDGMAFDQKEQVRKRILKNGTLFEINQQLMATNRILAESMGQPEVETAVSVQNEQAEVAMEAVGSTDARELPGGAPVEEPAHMRRTKQQVADSTTPT